MTKYIFFLEFLENEFDMYSLNTVPIEQVFHKNIQTSPKTADKFTQTEKSSILWKYFS